MWNHTGTEHTELKANIEAWDLSLTCRDIPSKNAILLLEGPIGHYEQAADLSRWLRDRNDAGWENWVEENRILWAPISPPERER